MSIAHINPETGEEQPVKDHCLNVGRLAAEFGSKIGLPATAALAGILHDAGKSTKRFEDYLRQSAENPEDRSRRGSVNHSAAGAKYIYDAYFGADAVRRFTAQLLALVISSHHSGLPDIIGMDGTDEFTGKIHPDMEIDYEECISSFIGHTVDAASINEYFDKAADEITEIINYMKHAGISNAFSLHLLVKFVFSCLIDADRLDTFNFMSGKNGHPDHASPCGTAGLWRELSERLEEALKAFDTNNKIAGLRAEISNECKEFAGHKPGVYRLCVPTGGGKTLSGLRYALEHAKNEAFGKQRIFYIIPYTTIIDQTAKVIRDKLGRGDIVLEHHSNLVIEDGDEMHGLLTDRWNSPIVLTTMVQFMDTLFSGRTGNIRRLHQLANSVIIFDEIQSIPIKCIHLFNCAVNFLSKLCNATVVLCTATQPLLAETEKPVLLSKPENMVEEPEESFEQFRRVKVIDCCKNGGYGIEELAVFVTDRAASAGSSLVIVNTKKTAGDLFLELKRLNRALPPNDRFHLFHLSTNMCPAHRMDSLDRIRDMLGKEKIICVSTQLIEAGIDISFESVFRSVAGLDSIAQAAGRCNRNMERESGNVFIVNPKDENLTMLPDIAKGKECALRVLTEFRENPGFFGDDLLSPKAIEAYYRYYFHEANRKGEMDYPVKKENTTIYDLLAVNPKGTNAYEGRFGGRPQYPLKQAFKTAGEYFSVIDRNTRGVVVPYGKGKQLIAEMNGNCGISRLKALVREAQRYSVSLFENDMEKIDSGVYAVGNSGILALEERYYDNDLGVSAEGKPMEFLSI